MPRSFRQTRYARGKKWGQIYYPMRDTAIFHGHFPQRFHTDDACLQYLFQMRSENIRCPKCGRTGSYYFHRHPSKLCYTCNCGRFHFFPLKGTIFAHSALPLSKWFYGIFLMSKNPTGMTGKEMERELSVSYATAWRMMHKILSVRPPTSIWKRGRSATFNEYLQAGIH